MAHQTPQPLVYVVTQPCGLLAFLLEQVKGKSRNNIKALLSKKLVRVDNARISQFDYPLKVGQTVKIVPSVPAGPKLPFPILFEDSDFIVINKPAGLLSIATEKEKEVTAYHILTDYLRTKTPGSRIFIVHRLDRDTSGVLLFAKNEQAKFAFQDRWDALVKKRGYLAVVEGVPEQSSGTVHSWLRETTTHLVYSGQSTDGKEAITHYTVLESGSAYSLLEVTIDTGRKNQIRVHMKDIGHPVAGDKKYGAATNPLQRLCLHAHQLVFEHPLTGVETTFHAKPPKEFASVLQTDILPKKTKK